MVGPKGGRSMLFFQTPCLKVRAPDACLQAPLPGLAPEVWPQLPCFLLDRIARYLSGGICIHLLLDCFSRVAWAEDCQPESGKEEDSTVVEKLLLMVAHRVSEHGEKRMAWRIYCSHPGLSHCASLSQLFHVAKVIGPFNPSGRSQAACLSLRERHSSL